MFLFKKDFFFFFLLNLSVTENKTYVLKKKKSGGFLTHVNQDCGTEHFGRCRNMQGHGQTSGKRFGGFCL